MEGPGSISDESPDRLGPGTRLGKYEIVRLLGVGGMGVVYEGLHTEIGKRVAVKVLSPTIASVPGARARFLREAQLTSRVRHPNIVDVTDMGSEGGQTYLVMELLRGEDLAQRLARTGPLADEALADIMLPVCSAVAEAHGVGITHRDLKPQNIFLAVGPHSTQPKILDFGISKGSELGIAGNLGSLTATGAMIGTPFYLAPEQIMDARAAGPGSDQYALGVIMYECLTGHRPFEAENLFVVFQEIVSGHPLPPSRHRSGILPSLEAIVLRAMSLDPGGRFSSVWELGRFLLPFSSNRVRSIWEEAFNIHPSGFVAPLAAPSDSGSPPIARASTPPGAPRVTNPSQPRIDHPATPSGRVRVTVDVPLPGPSGPLASQGSSRQTSAPLATTGRQGGAAWSTSALAASSAPPGARTPSPRTRSTRRRNVMAWMGAFGLTGLVAGVGLRRLRSERGNDDPNPVGITPGGATETLPAPTAAPAPVLAAEPLKPRSFQVKIRVEPELASIELDGRTVGRGKFEASLPVDHPPRRLRITAEGYQDEALEFTDQTPPPSLVTLVRARRQAPSQSSTPGESGPPRPVVPRPIKRIRPHSEVPAPRNLNPNGAPVIE